jgi:hypothetical protein
MFQGIVNPTDDPAIAVVGLVLGGGIFRAPRANHAGLVRGL